ncbi:MAG TPA: class I SAM-dependent methyltransferase [Smithella sp.]|nr:class I SAM-dependent methyltransferase [Smithella sp.]
MSDRSASSTALGTLYMRAAHQLLDARPLILDDPAALTLLGEDAVRQIKESHEHHRTLEARALRAHVVLRSRFTEDRLAGAVGRGIAQYIILGAGFDTFAYRQPPWARNLKIFEIDQSATQAQKRARLSAAGMANLPNLRFADIDFERESLHDGLIRHGISMTVPTFFSWLGVTMYIQEEAINTVLRTVAGFPVQSEIVFTFTQPPDLLSGMERNFHSSLSRIVTRAGEPFVSYFMPEAIESKLRDAGFKNIAFLSNEEAEKRYFSGRLPDLYISKRSAIAYAML